MPAMAHFHRGVDFARRVAAQFSASCSAERGKQCRSLDLDEQLTKPRAPNCESENGRCLIRRPGHHLSPDLRGPTKVVRTALQDRGL
jgi:hypothetical protein